MGEICVIILPQPRDVEETTDLVSRHCQRFLTEWIMSHFELKHALKREQNRIRNVLLWRIKMIRNRIQRTENRLIRDLNPLNPELNHICCLLALLGAHHFLHVSRMRVKSLTFRLLMSYIYMEHPFLMFLDHTQRRSTVGRTPLD